MNLKYTLVILVFLLAINLGAQVPSDRQSKPIAIIGGTVHVGNGQVVNDGIITFQNGVIDYIGMRKPEDLSNFEVIIAGGKHIYPGIIAPNTHLGLVEIDAVRATRDMREVGSMNASVRSIIAYNTDSDIIPTIRSNGILIAQVTPEGGWISGSSSIVQLDAWNWEDAAIVLDNGIHMRWPDIYSRWRGPARDGEISKNENYNRQVLDIKTFFAEAKSYHSSGSLTTKNLKFESIKKLFDKKAKLFIRADHPKSMMSAIQFCNEMDIDPVIVGGRDAWKVADFLNKNNVPIVLRATQSLPYGQDEDIDQPFKAAKILRENNVRFCFSMAGAWEQRNLPFQAGQAVAFGLQPEAAIQALTLDAAKILGVENILGSIEKGKYATLIICSGDLLDIKTNHVETAFISGRKIDLDNKQKKLYRKYRNKYKGKN